MLDAGTTLSDDLSGRIRTVHFLLGCAVLLPWNAMITATPYFLSRLEGSSFKISFSSYLSLTFNVCGFVSLAHATATSKEASPSRRVFGGASIVAAFCAMLAFSTYFHPSPDGFFVFVMFSTVCMAVAGSYVQNAVIVVASLFGPMGMQAVMSGQAAVGVVVSAVQLFSAAASIRITSIPSSFIRSTNGEEAEVRAAFSFFGISTIFMLICIGAHTWLTRTPAYKAMIASLEQQRKAIRRPSTTTESLVSVTSSSPRMEGREHIWRVGKSNVAFNFALAYVFVITLAVFPPITVSILPTNPVVHPLLFSAFHFLVFNVGDLLGRTICSWPQALIWSSTKILILSVARTLFIPLFLLCNVQRSFSPSSLLSPDAVITSDSLYMLILLAFGFSNGYVTSIGMIAAPSIEHNPQLKGRREDVDVAATLGSFSIVGGLALGSLVSFAVRAALCECNPFY